MGLIDKIVSGFNHKNTPENGKPAILPYGNGSVVLDNVNGKLGNAFYSVGEDGVVKSTGAVCLPVVEIADTSNLTDGEKLLLESYATAGMPLVITANGMSGVYNVTPSDTGVYYIFCHLLNGARVFTNEGGSWFYAETTE